MTEIKLIDEEDKETKKSLIDLGRDCFPFLQGLLIEETPHMLSIHHKGNLVGGTINEVLEPAPEKKIGLVTWIFTAPDQRGIGASQSLLEETIHYLKEEQGCEEVIAIVEWSNTSSSKTFAGQGFTRTNAWEVIDELGLKGAAKTWLGSMYWPALGYDLWTLDLKQPSKESESGPMIRRAVDSIAVNTAFFSIAVASLFGIGFLTHNISYVLGVIGIAFFARMAPQTVIAYLDNDDWRYYSWGSVYPFSSVFPLIGLYLPVPGNPAPRGEMWTYREKKTRFGVAATVSAMILLVLYAASVMNGVFNAAVLPDSMALITMYTLWFYVLLDVVLIGFPFDTYNARVIYDWNRAIWLALAVIALALLGLAATQILPIL